MCFSVKKLTIAGLLLLLSVANSAPTSQSPVDKADIAAITPEVTLKRYYMLPCHGHKHHDRTLTKNQCQGFYHGFPAFKLDMPRSQALWSGMGTCKLSFYRDNGCNDFAFSVSNIETGEYVGKCGWMNKVAGGVIAHGVKLECSKDEEQVEEVEVGGVVRMD